ncbi:malonyl-ACP O-methyltransferase BioC [Halochromatium glycolicum]|uniref:Malonyl-[acyl-carrier protein] O-methyltransferase n=1 Tax=Halochromatium glycolicum TaxID=85075 RepID=A0AAJ0U7N0_9GAMM|nr:malonyl-ACP O-methyltransferase BioC [Halochromatium glycolicum]MBK1706814.1 malonyl-[acyl-carrier protein] O-methyltransferase BioC [Halochromatium glycolicum]
MSAISPIPIDKRAARRAFERAAASYDQAAVLQREIGTRMLERLDYVRLTPKTVLDLGCGTGHGLDDLARRWRRARVIALDLAEAMLQRARRRGTWLNRPKPVCADLESLPLADDSVDLIVSNATLQWAGDLAAAFAEMRRVLRPEGLLMFTTFGPDTLIELRRAWAAADGGAHPHVSPFLDMHDIGDALVRAGFADPVMDAERVTMTYSTVTELMRDLKAIGGRNALQARARAMTGRATLSAMEQAYEQERRDGRLPSTWEVVYGHAWMPAGVKTPPQQQTDEGVAIPVGTIPRRAAGQGRSRQSK